MEKIDVAIYDDLYFFGRSHFTEVEADGGIRVLVCIQVTDITG